MNDETERLFYPIVDAFQLPVELFSIAPYVGCATGTMYRDIPVFKTQNLEFKVSALGYFHSSKKHSVGLMLKGPGDLYIMSMYNDIHSVLSVFLIDRVKLGVRKEDMLNIIPVEATPVEAVEAVYDGVVKSFYRRTNDTSWSTFEYNREKQVFRAKEEMVGGEAC